MTGEPYFNIVSFTINGWVTGSYDTFDLVRATSGEVSGQYFMSLVDGNSLTPESADLNQSVTGSWLNFQDTNFDFNDAWEPSYESSTDHQPRVNSVSFGDGYTQRSSNGINHQQTSYQLTFSEITSKEARSVLAFMEYKGGVGKFRVTLPDPFVKQKNFVAPGWNHQFVGYNRNNVSINLIESNDSF